MKGQETIFFLVLGVTSMEGQETKMFLVIGVTCMKGQETKRFLGARNSSRLLVGWEDNFVPLWESGERRLWRHIPTTG